MSESSKEKILRVANVLFAEKGYEATSVREIANGADVNLASINYYFESKQGLFEFMVKDFTETKFSAVVSVLEPPKTQEEFKLRLTLFMRQFLALSSNEKDAFRMINKNIEVFAKVSPEKFGQTFLHIHHQFLDFVKAAQKANILKAEFNPDMLAQILFGSLIDLIKGNDMRKLFKGLDIENVEYFDSYINTMIELFINGMGVNH